MMMFGPMQVLLGLPLLVSVPHPVVHLAAPLFAFL